MNSEIDYQLLEIQALQRIADSLEQLVQQQQVILQALLRLTQALEQMVPPAKPSNYQLALESWTTFDWASIGATVERQDEHGPTIINWRGQQFTRRSPNNRFKESIWYSRCTGKDANGTLQYERLCTFKPLASVEIDPLPERVRRLVHFSVEQ